MLAATASVIGRSSSAWIKPQVVFLGRPRRFVGASSAGVGTIATTGLARLVAGLRLRMLGGGSAAGGWSGTAAIGSLRFRLKPNPAAFANADRVAA